jgi:hypothetical protein
LENQAPRILKASNSMPYFNSLDFEGIRNADPPHFNYGEFATIRSQAGWFGSQDFMPSSMAAGVFGIADF